MRKILGEKQLWIQTSEQGYYLASDVSVINLDLNILESLPQIKPMTPSVNRVNDLNLNFRQLQALEYLRAQKFINTRLYKELFQTTEITACRDLASLKKLGYVIKVGRGRSTHYMLSKEENL